ncbi:flavodoxin domain-containing protein [Anoxybacterium hadale]|uniref:flavodoxin domain-containing protein n=1 Tax=Anoxybacterium hadale TaxID=3408580 RepID=UPI003AFFEA47
MKKTAIVYRSKSGFTEKYAKWIAKAVDGELLEAKKVRAEDLLPYDTIVYGGGLYAVGINGISLITDNLKLLKDKKIIVFGVGASPCRPEIVEHVRNKNIAADQRNVIEFHLLRGGFDKNKLTFVDQILMQFLKRSLKKKKELTPDERGMLNAYELPVDFTAEKQILPIVESVLQG